MVGRLVQARRSFVCGKQGAKESWMKKHRTSEPEDDQGKTSKTKTTTTEFGLLYFYGA